MDRRQLKELASNPEFISGIYNYCDRWCERCPFTARCLLFATEQADPDQDDPETHDLNSAKFWNKLGSMFAEVRQMILEWAEEEGIDLEAAASEPDVVSRQQQREDAKEHPLSLAAREYGMCVEDWFKAESVLEERIYDDTALSAEDERTINIKAAVEVIRWYQFFIAAKTYRALMGLAETEDIGDLDFESFDDEEQDDEMTWLGASASDAEGSAKIALIAIDRSLSCWRVVQSAFPEKTDSIKPMLIELEKLRRGIEQTFPGARDFIRPGLDEVASDFVS